MNGCFAYVLYGTVYFFLTENPFKMEYSYFMCTPMNMIPLKMTFVSAFTQVPHAGLPQSPKSDKSLLCCYYYIAITATSRQK